MSVCVHGLGYIGLATASLFANNGHEVVGYDTDPDLRAQIRSGEVSTAEPSLNQYVERALANGLEVRDQPVAADHQIICVPTPIDQKTGEADLTYVKQVGDTLTELVRPGDVVVLESTVPPGTTQDCLAPILAGSGYEPGTEFGVGYTPETVLPGNTVHELLTNDRIVGGVDRESRSAIVDLFDPVTSGTVYCAPDATTAEFAKLAQNAFRYVNVAYANALALLADEYSIDVRDATDLANNHPRVDILSPGPGVGGHCLPIDPLFLRAGSEGDELIDCAKATNSRMPEYVVDRLETELGGLGDATVAVLGIAYKGNVSDTRNSPGLAVARELRTPTETRAQAADGGWSDVETRLTDPYVGDNREGLVSLTTALTGAGAAVITTGHDEYAELDPERIDRLMNGGLVFDTVDLLDPNRWTNTAIDVVQL